MGYLPLGPSSEKQERAYEAFLEVDVLVLGGAMFGGKSYLATMFSSIVANDPNSRIAVFRTSLEDMKKGGSIIDTFRSVYRNLEDHCKLDIGGNPPVGKIVSGPGAGAKKGDGCKIEFTPIPNESKLESIRGAQYTLAIVEEAIPHFSRESIEFILSRCRSESKYDSKMIITCNPDPDHFICDLIKGYYLDEEGNPIDERCGDIRFFYNQEGNYVWGDSKEEVLELVGFEDTEDNRKKIKSFSFVQLTIFDNPIGMEKNPGYLGFLENLSPVKKARNLYGNWFARDEGSSVFHRHWLRGTNGERVKTIADIPKNCVARRGVDKAYSVPSDTDPTPDFTAVSPLILKDQDGFYWLLGNYHPKVIDEKPFRKTDRTYLGKFRKLSGERDNLLAMQLKLDDVNKDLYGHQSPSIVIAKETASGVTDFNATVARMLEEGIDVKKDQTIQNVKGKKMADFLPFCTACELGMVFIVEETFDPESLEAWYTELEKFDGGKSGRLKKDDWVDATAITYNSLATAKRPYSTPPIHFPPSSTFSSNYLRSR